MITELAALPKVSLSPLGLDVAAPLTLQEWRDIGRCIVRALRSIAFVVGDWLVYGEADGQLLLFAETPEARTVPGWLYEEAARLTGLDVATLQNYAYVSRNVPRSLRNEHVSWDHHKKVAKLKNPAEKQRWLGIAAEKFLADQPVSVRRFARSIQAGRLLTRDEISEDDADTGIENVHPYVNRIVAFYGRLKDTGWLAQADEHKRAALKRDLYPVVEIYQEL